MGGVGPSAESKLTSLLAADVGTRFAGSRSRCGDCGSLGREYCWEFNNCPVRSWEYLGNIT